MKDTIGSQHASVLDGETVHRLVDKAIDGLRFCYAPYSNFHVSAALLAEDGTVYTGCNIENAAYTPTNCAERTAFFKAVSEGVRSFRAIAIAGGPEGRIEGMCAPCGVCLQVMMEFCAPETFEIILPYSKKEWSVYRLEELLPLGFRPDDLKPGSLG